MRARNREINIFNMSLLDILCGALGAFCFMMLVALPYYKPGSKDAQDQVDLENTLKEIEKLKEELNDPDIAKKLGEILRTLTAQVKALEGQLNRVTLEKQQLQDQVDDLNNRINRLDSEKQELQKKNNDLARREPFSVFVTLNNFLEPTQRGRVHLYLWQNSLTDKKEPQKPFDPRKESYDIFWIGEQTYWVTGSNPYASWMEMNVDAGITWKIYAKLELWTPDPTDPKKRVPVPLSGNLSLIVNVNSYAGTQSLPDIVVSPEHPWVLAGFITTDKNDSTKITVRGATDAERAAEWKALDKK